MAKVVMFSDLYLPTHPYLEIPLLKELRSRGISVIYVLQGKDIRMTDKKLSGVFKKYGVKTIKGSADILGLMRSGDTFVSRFVYKGFGAKVAAKVAKAGYKVLMLDPSGIDIRVRECVAPFLTAKSESLKKATLKKFPKRYKHIFVTGTIHHDAAKTTVVDRNEFMQSYGLDPNKKFALLTPANPGEAWMSGLKDDYKQIVNIVRQNPDYELALKAHPLDYTASMPAAPGVIHKNEHYNGKHSWEELCPDITVIKPDEGYKSIKACDVVLNIRSSLAIEIPLFRKPLININRHKYVTNWPFDENVMSDIMMGELSVILALGLYEIDRKACKEYCKRVNYSDDGKAYMRTADAITTVFRSR